MSGQHNKYERRAIRRMRIRKRVTGDGARPRLSVFRSGVHIYAQLVDDERGVTLAQASSREKDLDVSGIDAKGRIKLSMAVGRLIALRGQKAGVAKVSFDRGGYIYHGRVKALADGARAGGLEF
ncbi:MAG: 50S ribosomal protein L18 [Candidatus Eisenbacteria bacterium]